MQTRSKSGALPPPAPPAAEGPGPREMAARQLAAELLGGPQDTERMIVWLMAELGRQGDLIDRLTSLLPAAEAAAARLAHPIRGAFGRGGQAAAVDITGGKPR